MRATRIKDLSRRFDERKALVVNNFTQTVQGRFIQFQQVSYSSAAGFNQFQQVSTNSSSFNQFQQFQPVPAGFNQFQQVSSGFDRL